MTRTRKRGGKWFPSWGTRTGPPSEPKQSTSWFPLWGTRTGPSSVPQTYSDSGLLLPETDDTAELRDTKDIMIFVTRHANSCNNIVGTNKTPWATQNQSIYQKKSDPSLSVSGVLTVLALDPPHIQLFKGEDVHVSVLVRTWMTALLLYGKQVSETPLNLKISPFLKEQKTDPGNMPTDVQLQVKKFVTFRCFLKSLLPTLEPPMSTAVENCLSTRVIITRVDTRAVIYDSLRSVQCPQKKVDPTYVSDILKNQSFFKSVRTKIMGGVLPYVIPDVIQGVAPCRSQEGPVKSEPLNDYAMVQAANLEQINAPYHPCMQTYDPHGIVHFYQWLSPILQPGSKVFVVAHSNIMQESLRKSFKMSPHLARELDNPGAVFNQNAWTLYVRCNDGTLVADSYSTGIPKTVIESVNFQHEYICKDDEFATTHIKKRAGKFLSSLVSMRTGSPRVPPPPAQTHEDAWNMHTGQSTPLLHQPRRPKILGVFGGRKFRSKKRKHNRTFKKK